MDLQARIPNNVNLADSPRLRRAMEAWQPNFLSWWREVGPLGFQEDEIYLRTAVSVEPGGWASFEYVKMPDYRWGIFLAPPGRDRITFGDHLGEPVWDTVPGDMRAELRRIIVTQADTEPASVEQQHLLGKTAPSLYDLRNLFQVNVEEGRHLWAMVYLLHCYFGRDGREEAEALLTRRSGHPDTPRVLSAFNDPVQDWLDFFCFTMFADRDGKFQLAALAESAFAPLYRSTQFMLTEEAHHLFVGETGLRRIISRTAELMKSDPNEDVSLSGGIPLDIIQRYINKWFSRCLDLFGSEDSTNAAVYFARGLKGRYRESQRAGADHLAIEAPYVLEQPDGAGGLSTRSIPARRAMNALLQDAYIEDCQRALEGWNAVLQAAGLPHRLMLPSRRFNRAVGSFAGHAFDPHGARLQTKPVEHFLPSVADAAHVASLMVPCHRPGAVAGWISPPAKGINGRPEDFDYVRFAHPQPMHRGEDR